MNVEALELHRGEAENPQWDDPTGRRGYTWRWFVDDEIRAIWKELPVEARMAIVAVAEKAVDNVYSHIG